MARAKAWRPEIFTTHQRGSLDNTQLPTPTRMCPPHGRLWLPDLWAPPAASTSELQIVVTQDHSFIHSLNTFFFFFLVSSRY